MRVSFDASVLGDETSHGELDRILYTVEDGWHLWQVDDPELVESGGWLEGARASLRELFERAVRSGAYRSDRQRGPHLEVVVVTREPAVDTELAPGAARRYLSRPLEVLVENQFTDAAFVEVIIEHLGWDALRDLLQCAPPPLAIRGAGGAGEMPKHISQCVQAAAADKIPLRLVVLADSDGHMSGEIREKATRVRDLCQEHDVPCHVLRKREIENYIPDDVLVAWSRPRGSSERRARVEALRRLDRQQRDHYPMKKGLRNKAGHSAELFSTISAEDRAALDQGFGSDVIAVLSKEPQAVTADGLRQRDGCGELDAILRMIAERL